MAVLTREEVVFVAKVYGWVEIPNDSMFASFKRGTSRINIWENKGGTFTVGTAVNHPKQGKTQLFRRGVYPKMLESIFENPRVHTSRGYKRKY